MTVLAQPLVSQPVQIFFIVLVIILTAPLLLNKLKIPHIIGMIVAGVVVGPYGLNILADDSSFAIFGQVGMLYLMFLAGLEIDMFHLQLNLRRGLAFGILTLLIPLALGILTSVYLLHTGWITAMLLGAMYASHTLISYPVAARFGITRAPSVLIAIVGTIIAVIGALLVLAATVNIHREGAFNLGAVLWLIVKLAVWCAAMLIAVPRVTRWFFKQYNDKVTQYVYVMAVVFLSAASAQLIGLETVLGAFLAGLILNRFVPPASPLMSSIEFVGNALFIPYFLIGVGMMINIGVIVQRDTLMVAAIMLSVAIVSKWIPAAIAQRAAGLGGSSRRVIFGLTAAHTAVALAVVTLGYDMGMFDETILNSTILVILITCALAPIVTAVGARRLKIHMLTHDGDGDLLRSVRTNNTLVAVTNPMTASGLVELAVLMRNDNSRHSFYGIHVRTDNSKAARAVSELALKEAVTTAAAADTQLKPLDRFDINTVTGLLNAIEERDITETILGLHHRTNVIDSVLGNIVSNLLKQSNRQFLILRSLIPLNTITGIIVMVPPKAQFEDGFSRWVRCIARLTRQVGCRVTFCCAGDTQPLITEVIMQENIGIRVEFDTIDDWDDMVLHTTKVHDDDLMVVIGARPNSVSYCDAMTEIPTFITKYFSRNNLLLIYPEQFGHYASTVTSFGDPMSTDITSAASPLFSRLRSRLRVLRRRK